MGRGGKGRRGKVMGGEGGKEGKVEYGGKSSTDETMVCSLCC